MAHPDNDIDPSSWFNPHPDVTQVALGDRATCFVIDNALLEPERLRDWATARRDAFREVDFNAYPGVYHIPPNTLGKALNAYYHAHIEPRFDVRGLLQMESRLAMVTRPAKSLQPMQCLCHSDQAGSPDRYRILATVLYLFEDPSLGGTRFYQPAVDAQAIRDLFRDSSTMSPQEFARVHGIEPGYMRGSNDFFTQIGEVPARWNRMIVYDGNILHSGDIGDDRRLTDDPASGRLTYNGFFTCRRN